MRMRWLRLSRRPSDGFRPLLGVLLVFAAIATFVSVRDLDNLVGFVEEQSTTMEEFGAVDVKTSWQSFAHKALGHVEELPTHARSPGFSAELQVYRGTGSTLPPKGNAPSEGVDQVPWGVDSVTAGKCVMMPHTDYFGEALVWGYGNKRPSAEACCNDCTNYKKKHRDDYDCNLWVYCGNRTGCGDQYQDCWLKHLTYPSSVKPTRGPSVAFTAGFVGVDALFTNEKEDTMQSSPGNDRKYHIVITAQGSAVHWQSRIHYYWYKKVKAQCEKAGPCDMGGFTRILHSGKPDDLMEEIPTFVAKPLPDHMKKQGTNKGYVVINRPYAFVQWVQQAKIKEKYILMSEPDHLYLKPMPNFMKGDNPAAFPFFYIEPSKKEFLPITRRFVGDLPAKEIEEKIAPIGNAPTMLTFKDMKKVAQTWMDTSIKVFEDPQAEKEWGWVQEMYAFTLALYISGVRNVNTVLNMMAQPPWDAEMLLTNAKPYYILHYTYGMDYALNGTFTPGKIGEWRFDKRTYSMKPPTHLGPPPEGMGNELVRTMINMFNQAMADIPCWDDYSKDGVVRPCNAAGGG